MAAACSVECSADIGRFEGHFPTYTALWKVDII